MKQLFVRPDAYLGRADYRNIRLKEDVLPNAPKAFRAIFLTDIHLRPKVDPAPIAQMLDDHPADMILFGGDFADTRAEALRFIDAMKGIAAPMGIYAVPGNNDAEAFRSMHELSKALERMNCRLLVNECVRCPEMNLAVGGVDEPLWGQPDYEKTFRDWHGKRLLLSHYPILPKAEVMPDWMLCGHTHGGQFNLLGVTPYTIGFEYERYPARVSGLHRIQSTTLLVSKGLGASRIPLRIGVRPEIHLLHFEVKEDKLLTSASKIHDAH